MITVSMTVNGEKVSREVEDSTFLAYYLREALGLTGTHVGCDTTQCGCCVVHMNGTSVKSCTVLAAQAEGATVTTIEGLAKDGQLHPRAARLPRMPRPAMRLLHAGDDHGGRRSDRHLSRHAYG